METEIKNKTKSKTSTKIAIGLIVVSLATFGYAATQSAKLLFYTIDEDPGDGEPIVNIAPPPPSPNTPFVASEITSVSSVLTSQDNLSGPTFSQQYHYLGSTQVYRQMDYQNGLVLGSVTTAQPLSIQIGGGSQGSSVETGSMQPQLVHITYRTPGSTTDKYFTFCLAQTNQTPTREYFSIDGSAFKDAALTERYITKTCTEIKNQALKYPNPTDLSLGSTTWTEGTLAFRSYMQDRLVVQAYGSKTVNAPVGRALNFSDPLAVLVSFQIPPHTPPYVIPPLRLIVVGGTPSGTTTLCYPGVSQNTQAERHPIYFDTNGKSYSDLFLQNQIPCELPPLSESKTQLKVSDIIGVSSVTEDQAYGPNPFAEHKYLLNGQLAYRQTSQTVGTHVTASPTNADLSVFLDAFFYREMAKITYRKAGSSTDNYLTICVGPRTGLNAPIFVAMDGSTYMESSLTNLTTTTTCGAIKARALTYSNPTQLSLPPTIWTDRVDLTFRRGLTNRLLARRDINSLTGFQYTVSPQIPTLSQTNGDPLALDMTFQNVGHAAPYVIPTMGLNLQNSLPIGTTKICIPGATRTNTDRFGPMYFDKIGQPYSDIFLTQIIPCVPPTQ